jgi:hypothetical protein
MPITGSTDGFGNYHPGPNLGIMSQQMSAFAPIASGIHHRPTTGFEGMPFADMPFLGGMIQQQMGGMFARMGFMPTGINQQNAFDVMRNRQFTMMHDQFIAKSSEQERENWMRTMRGIARITGTPFGAEQMRAAGALTDIGISLAPTLALQNPGLFEALGGMRGSPTVMAAQMAQASRYRIDPVTGRMGMSGDTLQATHERIFNDLFGPDADIAQMQGVTAGQAGQLFRALQQRGMVRGITPEERATEIRQATGRTGEISTAELDQLALDPAVSDRLRAFDADRIKQSLTAYTDAVSAMRDIFGDMGRPDAPMQELMQGLEALTSGAVGQVQPGRLAEMVRMTRELSRATGVPLQNAFAMQMHAANQAARYGLAPVLANQATQGALAFGGAYRGTGEGAFSAWGRLTSDQVQQLDTNLRVNAAASQNANRLAVVMRVNEMMGTRDPETGEFTGGFREGSEAARLVEQLRLGVLDEMPTQEELMRIVTSEESGARQQGITRNTFKRLLTQRFQNQEMINRFDIGNIIRRQQPREVRGMLTGNTQNIVANRLREMGIDPDVANKAAREVSGRVVERAMALDSATFTDPSARSQAMGRAIQDALAGTDAGRQLAETLAERGIDDEAFFETTADLWYGETDRWVRGNAQTRYMGGAQGLHQLFNDKTLAWAEQRRRDARVNVMMQQAAAPLGRGTLLSRAIEAVQRDPEGDIKTIVARTFGVPMSDVQGAMVDSFTQVQRQLEKIDAAKAKFSSATTPEARTIAYKELQNLADDYRKQVQGLVNTAEELGMYHDETLTEGDVQKALNASKEFNRFTKDVEKVTDPEFRRSEEGRVFRDAFKRSGATSADVAAKALMSTKFLKRAGRQGLESIKNVQGANQRLRELAFLHTGGDISMLFSGTVTPEVRKEVGEIMKSRSTALQEIGRLMRDEPSLDRQALSDKEIEDLQRELSPWAPGGELAQELLTTFGVDRQLQPGSAEEQGMLNALGSRAGRGFARSLIASQKTLEEVAGRGGVTAKGTGAVDLLYDDWMKARNKEGGMDEFRKTYRLGKDEDFVKFERAMQLQERTNFIRFGPAGPGGVRQLESVGDVTRLLEDLVQGGRERGGEDRVVSLKEGTTLKLTGELELKGGDLSAEATVSPGETKEHAPAVTE